MGADETGTLVPLRGRRSEQIDPLIAIHRGREACTLAYDGQREKMDQICLNVEWAQPGKTLQFKDSNRLNNRRENGSTR